MFTTECSVISLLPQLNNIHKLGANFSIGTDDTLCFSTNIQTELFEVAQHLKMDVQEIIELMVRNTEALFADQETMEWVKDKLVSYRV
jgi:adenosine deaminase